MSKDQKISAIVKYHLPEFVRNNYPTFVTLLESYYEYMEQEDKELYSIYTHQDNTDVLTTLDTYVKYFRSKYGISIPNNLFPRSSSTNTSSLRVLLQQANDFYKAKGTDDSIKMLFRVLWNEEIDIYKPTDTYTRAQAQQIFSGADQNYTYFYSPYAYVIKSITHIDDYEDIIIDSVHPVGMNMFGHSRQDGTIIPAGDLRTTMGIGREV